LAELDESARSATPQETSVTAAVAGLEEPTERRVLDAVKTVEVLSSPIGIGDPGHSALFVMTIPPEPDPVE